MTDKWRCALLVAWLKRRGVRFRIHDYEARVHLRSKRQWRGARGQAEAYAYKTRGAGLIRLWAPKPGHRNGWRDLANCIIHEYGHLVLRRVPHTEREAWRFGRRAVPRRYVPTNFHHRRVVSLASYGQAADRRTAYPWLTK